MDDSPFRTLADLPFYMMRRHPKEASVGRCRAGGVDACSSQEFFERTRNLAIGLGAMGTRPGDRVAILAESRPEWLLADLAVLSIGAVTVPIYPTLTGAQALYLLKDAAVRLVFVSDRAQLQKIQQVRHDAPTIEAVILMTGSVEATEGSVLTLGEVTERGRRRLHDDPGADREYENRARQVTPGDLATLIYTSGTTGDPKGVMLTHGNLVANVKASNDVLKVHDADVALSFLPLSHVFERTVAYVYLSGGTTLVFAESADTLGRDLQTVRPMVMTGVPRAFEKMRSRVLEAGAQGSAVRRRVFTWAIRVAERRSQARLSGREPSVLTSLQHVVADRLVLSKIRAGFGSRLKFMVSGSAALQRSVGEFFEAVGVRILEGYGLTETSPVLTVNPPDAPRYGTVGKTIPGVELRIGDDGEILARGPNVTPGYFNKPEATAIALAGGWFHTGDVGEIDADGYLRITDRKKDILVTSGGKKIVPQVIESTFKSSPLVAEAVLIGEKRRFPAVLLVPDFSALERRLRDLGRPAGARAELVRRPDVLALYQELIDGVNHGLAQFERIKKFAVLPEEFSIERGELTPTMKVRRRAVEDRWQALIEGMYRES